MKKFLLKKLNFKFSKLLTAIILILVILLSIGVAYAFDVFVGGSENVATGKGLVGHWTLDGEDYNSATNRVTDRTPYSNHGTNYGATLTTDRFGKAESAVSFDGVDDYIDLSGKALDNPSTYNGKATVSLWIKPNEHNNGFARYIAGFHYWMVNSNGKLQNMVNKPSYGVNYWLYGTKTIPIGEWTHVVYQLENNVAVRYYVDGVLDAQHENSSLEIVSYSTLSAVGAIYNDFFNGSIEDVRIYNRILSEDEIKLLHESYNPSMKTASTESRLIGHWKLENSGFVEYTANLAPYTDYSDRTYNQEYEASCWGGDLGTMYYYSSGGYNNFPYKKMIKTAGGTGGCYHDNHLGITIKNNTVYTVSAWMKANQSVTVNGYALDLNRPLDNAYRVGSNIQLTTEWQRYFWVYSAGSDHAGTYHARNIIYVDDNLPIEIYWSGFQVEERSYTTPYVNGIRQSKLTDSTPYSNHGTINGTNLTTDRFGKAESAVSFDGVDDYVNVDMRNLGLTGSQTIVAWIKPYGPPSGQAHQTVLATDPDYQYGVKLMSFKNTARVGLWLGTGSTNYEAFVSTDINDGNWHFVAGIYNYSAGTVTMFIDGIKYDSINSGQLTIDVSTIGKIGVDYHGISNNYVFNGSMDDVRIYNRALSEDEVRLLYESYKPQSTTGSANAGLILDLPLTSKWTKSETPGSERMTDRTPYSNDGQNSGATINSTGASFDGTWQRVDASATSVNTYLTLGAWIYPKSYPAERSTIIVGVYPAGYYLSLASDGSLQCYWYGTSPEGYHSSGAGTVFLDKWSYVAATWNGSSVKLYIDGILKNTIPVTGTGTASTLNIIGAESSGRQFIGTLSNVRIYNRALSADEVKLLFDRGRA